jgi:dynein heavy chain
VKLLHLENFIEFESCVCVCVCEREREMGISNVNLEKEQCWVRVVGMCLQVTKYTQASEIEEKPRDGCYITGLYLEGASWDEKISMLRVQDPKILVVELPILQIIPIEASKLKLTNTFRTPVYVTQARRNAMGVGLIFEADIATTIHPSHWVLQGVAICLTIDH